ncbi:hypothetical protein K7432_004155 [Basidiobolus ranarum]|uniref:Peptidase S1 domain-containing protein n=1 Tax=Basidiobolus ranarum TaxID=34480 RepID=A0ABR2WYU0_9FUNG
MIYGKFEPGQNVSAGDPGGPLYQRQNDNQAKVYGLITGDSSHDPNFYSFVNLEYHINWIAHTTGIDLIICPYIVCILLIFGYVGWNYQ